MQTKKYMDRSVLSASLILKKRKLFSTESFSGMFWPPSSLLRESEPLIQVQYTTCSTKIRLFQTVCWYGHKRNISRFHDNEKFLKKDNSY